MKLTGIYGIQDALLDTVTLSMQTIHLFCESKFELLLATINHRNIELAYYSELNLTNNLLDNESWNIGLIYNIQL